MKKIAFVFVLIIALSALLVYALLPDAGKTPSDYIRIHIRANSDTQSDQDVKYLVRDAVINLLIPLLAESNDYSGAKNAIEQSLAAIERETERVLGLNGKTYKARATLSRENFPNRAYFNGLNLPKGIYDAIIIELGEASGANWWCVAFPPLCFIPAEGSGQVRYRSKILEIVENFR